MVKFAHTHAPNSLGALDEYGRMVCSRCGHGYDREPEQKAPSSPLPVVPPPFVPVHIAPFTGAGE